MTPQGLLATLRALPERLRRRRDTDIIGAIATLRAETLLRAAAGGGSGLGKHLLRCYVSFRRVGLGRGDALEKTWRVFFTAVKDEADGLYRGPKTPIDDKHNNR